MNFSDAVVEVVDIVKRPDKIKDVRREINAAITFFCLDNDFPRDFTEQKITLDPLEYTQSFSLSDLSRFRKFKYIKRGPQAFLTILSENEIFNKSLTSWNLFKDRYYVVGDTVNIALAALVPTIDIGYFMYPPVLTGSLTSNNFWLLDISPYMIINRAAANIFRIIGDETSMKTHLLIMDGEYTAFRKDQRSVM